MFFESGNSAVQRALYFTVGMRVETFDCFAGCRVDRCNGHARNLHHAAIGRFRIVGQAFPHSDLEGRRQEYLPYKLAEAAMITNADLLESKRDRANRKRIAPATPATPLELRLPGS